MLCACCSLSRPPGRRGVSRRAVLGMALGAAGAALAGCDADSLGGLGASLVPPDQERQFGAQAFEQILAQTPVSDDPELNGRVERVGKRVVAASGAEIPPSEWRFVVFDTPEVNAFALPGGHIGVYRGMFDVARDDDALATVLGHETGHVNAHHAAQRIGATELTGFGVQALSTALQLGGVRGGDQLASLIGAGAQYGIILPFSRAQEFQADRLGLGYMARARYDPSAALRFWQGMMRASGRGGAPPAFASTHPPDQDRIAQLRQLLPGAERAYLTA